MRTYKEPGFLFADVSGNRTRSWVVWSPARKSKMCFVRSVVLIKASFLWDLFLFSITEGHFPLFVLNCTHFSSYCCSPYFSVTPIYTDKYCSLRQTTENSNLLEEKQQLLSLRGEANARESGTSYMICWFYKIINRSLRTYICGNVSVLEFYIFQSSLFLHGFSTAAANKNKSCLNK